MLLLAEELFLLMHDDESGKASTATLSPDAALAGALLLDLAEAEAIEVDDKTVRVTGRSDDPLLAAALEALADTSKPKSVSHWVQRLPGKLKPLQTTVGESLVARGVLEQQRGKVLGVFPTTRWPERDPAPERELRAGLADVLVRGVTPTPHQAMLVPLLSSLDLVKHVVEKDDRKQARATAREIGKAAKDGKLVSNAVSQTVANTQMALLLVIMTPAVTASAT